MIPRCVHLLVRNAGGGAETNIRRLCDSVDEFHYVSLEDSLGHPPNWMRLGRLRTEVAEIDPKIVFCYGITTHLIAAALFHRRILVGSIRCESDFAGAKGILRRIVAPRFRTWVSNSRAALGAIPGHVIHNGIPIPAMIERPKFEHLPRPVFGLLARGHPKKGHDFLLQLWQDLGKPGSLLFGGDLGPDLKARAEAAGVLCPGFVEPGPFLSSLDLLLVPSAAEGIPTVLLEAMVRSIPCLSTPVGGVEELLHHGKNGYCLPREDWEPFLRHFDAKAAHSLALHGRDTVVRDFSFKKMRGAFIALAAELAAGKA